MMPDFSGLPLFIGVMAGAAALLGVAVGAAIGWLVFA